MTLERRKYNGLTVAEVLVAMMVLLLLLSMLVMVFQTGANAWAKADAETELLQTLQSLMARMERDVERSSYESLTIEPGVAFSVLTPQQTDGTIALNPVTRKPRYRAYVIYYYDSASKTVLRTEHPLAAGSLEENTPGPIELYNDSPPKPLTAYLSGGNYGAWSITKFEPQVITGTELLKIDVEASRNRYGRSDPETDALSTTIHMRN